MYLSRVKKGSLLLLFLFIFTFVKAQTALYKATFSMEPVKSFCWDAGMHIAKQKTYHLGYAFTIDEKSCVLGNVSSGMVLGMTFDPTSDLKGVFVNRWTNIAIINIGWSLGFESQARNSWVFLEPQIGLGIQRFRISYGYHIPFFLDAKTETGGHTLSIAYSFAIQHH